MTMQENHPEMERQSHLSDKLNRTQHSPLHSSPATKVRTWNGYSLLKTVCRTEAAVERPRCPDA